MLGRLLERAASPVTECHRLSGQAGQSLGAALRPRLRAMNSYYTNKFEGQHTRSADIERALARVFDADARQARKQRLAVAHMEAEAELEEQVRGMLLEALYDPGFIHAIHAALYRQLPDGDRVTEDAEGVPPGAWRTRGVTAGRHLAPPAGAPLTRGVRSKRARWEASAAPTPSRR